MTAADPPSGDAPAPSDTPTRLFNGVVQQRRVGRSGRAGWCTAMFHTSGVAGRLDRRYSTRRQARCRGRRGLAVRHLPRAHERPGLGGVQGIGLNEKARLRPSRGAAAAAIHARPAQELRGCRDPVLVRTACRGRLRRGVLIGGRRAATSRGLPRLAGARLGRRRERGRKENRGPWPVDCVRVGRPPTRDSRDIARPPAPRRHRSRREEARGRTRCTGPGGPVRAPEYQQWAGTPGEKNCLSGGRGAAEVGGVTANPEGVQGIGRLVAESCSTVSSPGTPRFTTPTAERHNGEARAGSAGSGGQ